MLVVYTARSKQGGIMEVVDTAHIRRGELYNGSGGYST